MAGHRHSGMTQTLPHEMAQPRLLHRGDDTALWLVPGLDPSQDRIRKQADGPDAVRRLRHERAILMRLEGFDGVVQLAPGEQPADALLFMGGEAPTLAERLRTRPPDVFQALNWSMQLAHALCGVHRAGVVHKDIHPGNIVLVGEPARPVLMDFGHASGLAQEHLGFTHERHIAGTLTYMAPEQTGRTGRPVDSRADLYSLGVVMYEMLVGRPPFAHADVLDLIHAQLATVPVPLSELRPQIPPVVSALVMRLLEKEPDRRYLSAEGLRHDLQRLLGLLARHAPPVMPLGEQDFPLRLSPPSRLVGRDAERQLLTDALSQAITQRGGMVLVSGAPGVGKTALINELRPAVTALRGWFIAGKFDQYRQDAPTAPLQALRALGRLILAEPEAALQAHRERIRRALGPNLGVGPALLPEFALLLGDQPKVIINDPVEAGQRFLAATLDLLRAVASPQRPLVMVFDDLQWAPGISLQALNMALTTTEPVPGLLIVGAYRRDDVDALHPLRALMDRWAQLDVSPPVLALDNLPAPDVGALLSQMLRIAPDEGTRLAMALNEHTAGNPYDTVELVNALRAEQLLVPRQGLWHWDAAAVHQYMGDATVLGLLGRRLARLSASVVSLVQAMACLGGEVKRSVLDVVVSDLDLDACLQAASTEGLLVLEHGHDSTVAFRHDRVQQAVFERMSPVQRSQEHLRLARLLVNELAWRNLAAEQYLPAAAALQDPTEMRRVIDLFLTAAIRSRGLNYAVVERFLAAALALLAQLSLQPGHVQPGDAALRHQLKVQRHAALYGLARFDEADAAYAELSANCSDPLQLVDAAGVQMYSLNSRTRQADAAALGLALLSRLGIVQPPDMGLAVREGFVQVRLWVDTFDGAAELLRPEITDPLLLAQSRLLQRTATAAFFADQTLYAWLTLQSHTLWVSHGPCAPLLACVRALPMLLSGILQDYARAYATVRHVLDTSAARGYAAVNSLAHFTASVCATHWFEPVENGVIQVHRAFDGLLQSGELQYASFCHSISLEGMLDSEDSLDGFETELQVGTAFSRRTDNALSLATMALYRALLASLRGQTHAPGSLHSADYDEAAYEAQVSASPTVFAAMFHVTRATTALLFGDTTALVRHALAAQPAMSRLAGMYDTVKVYLLRALARAEQLRVCEAHEREALVQDLDEALQWLARRAADMPHNFEHLRCWVEAERAWSLGEVWRAGQGFDEAIASAQARPRLWHLALITERAGLFHLAHGMAQSGQPLLIEAALLYAAWGATGKVEQMRRAHPFLRAGRSAVAALGEAAQVRSAALPLIRQDEVDLMAVLRASQALSSVTQLDQLTVQLAQVMGAMTGAHAVRLVTRGEVEHDWSVHTSLGTRSVQCTLDAAVAEGLLALSPFRYAERTGVPLLVDDALSDDRFAQDPAFEGLAQCSLLLVPIVKLGELRAMLVLENRHQRSAFSQDRLDTITLIAGQLAVSLDNALLYSTLERKVAERTAELELANARWEALSLTDALTGLPNRRRFDEALSAEWLRARRSGTPLGLVMIDIDHFKRYNDFYGHQGGDECLQAVAQALTTGLRGGSDLVARYGGEEFVLLLPGVDADGALVVAERVRLAVFAMDKQHQQSPLRQVTVSLGVATTVPSDEGLAQALIEQADKALYEAKRLGRNRVACASGSVA